MSGIPSAIETVSQSFLFNVSRTPEYPKRNQNKCDSHQTTWYIFPKHENTRYRKLFR